MSYVVTLQRQDWIFGIARDPLSTMTGWENKFVSNDWEEGREKGSQPGLEGKWKWQLARPGERERERKLGSELGRGLARGIGEKERGFRFTTPPPSLARFSLSTTA